MRSRRVAQGEYITVHEAREMLRVSRSKMARLISEGTLETRDYPLDKRIKLVRRSDVEQLAATLQLRDGVASVE